MIAIFKAPFPLSVLLEKSTKANIKFTQSLLRDQPPKQFPGRKQSPFYDGGERELAVVKKVFIVYQIE
jgi:hypothetical protein